MRVVYLACILFLLLIFQGCGSDSSNLSDKSDRDHILNRDNFISISKYHFAQKSKELLVDRDSENSSRFRTYPGGSKSNNNRALTITAITPFNRYIESMDILANGRVIKIDAKKRSEVTISLHEGDMVIATATVSILDFKSFAPDLDGEL